MLSCFVYLGLFAPLGQNSTATPRVLPRGLKSSRFPCVGETLPGQLASCSMDRSTQNSGLQSFKAKACTKAMISWVLWSRGPVCGVLASAKRWDWCLHDHAKRDVTEMGPLPRFRATVGMATYLRRITGGMSSPAFWGRTLKRPTSGQPRTGSVNWKGGWIDHFQCLQHQMFDAGCFVLILLGAVCAHANFMARMPDDGGCCVGRLVHSQLSWSFQNRAHHTVEARTWAWQEVPASLLALRCMYVVHSRCTCHMQMASDSAVYVLLSSTNADSRSSKPLQSHCGCILPVPFFSLVPVPHGCPAVFREVPGSRMPGGLGA